MTAISIKQSLLIFVFMVLSFGSVGFIYGAGASGPFLLDDVETLRPLGSFSFPLSLEDVRHFIFGVDGQETDRWLSKLSFLVDGQSWPANPYKFKVTNIFIHLINGLLLTLIMLRLLPIFGQRYQFAILIVLLWLSLPIQVSTVLYVVQRMTLLMATFFLLSIYFYLLARGASRLGAQLSCLLLSAFSFFLSVSCKLNGALLLIIIPFVEFTFDRSSQRWCYPRMIRAGLMFSPAIFFLAFFFKVYQYYPGFSGRSFTLSQRLLIEGQILLDYQLKAIVGLGNISVFQDQYEWMVKSGGYKFYSVVAWLAHALIIIVSFRFKQRYPLIFFGVGWFYLAHIVESTAIPLELAFDHRNYIPSVGLCIAIVGVILAVASGLRNRNSHIVKWVIYTCVPLNLLVVLVINIGYWSNAYDLAAKWAKDNPLSLRSQLYFAHVNQLMKQDQRAIDILKSAKLRFNDPAIELQILSLQCKVNTASPDKIEIANYRNREFSSGFLHWMEVLVKEADFDCYEPALGHPFDLLIQEGFKLRTLNHKARYLARYADVAAAYYTAQRNFERAVSSREIAWASQPTTATALKLANLLISGGKLDYASYYVGEAKRINMAAKVPNLNMRREIQNIESLIEGIQRGQIPPHQ